MGGYYLTALYVLYYAAQCNIHRSHDLTILLPVLKGVTPYPAL